MRLEPALGVVEPCSVFIVDYGYHASLVLPPSGEVGSAEFAYGQFAWFALNRDEWYRVPGTLVWPQEGTIGRREFDGTVTRALLVETTYAEEIIELVVERANAARLRSRIDDRYEECAAGNGVTENPVLGLSFVRDPERYWALHNCNSKLAGWLEELGVGVRGCRLFAAFKVGVPRE